MSLTGKQQLTSNAPMTNDGFWPDIVLGEFVEKYRVPSEYDDGVISIGMTLAMVRINHMLKPAKSAAQALTHASLEAYAQSVNDDTVEGIYSLIHSYKHALFCSAKAFLLQQFNSLNRRKEAENAAKEARETEEYWLDQAQQSLYRIMQAMQPTAYMAANYATHVALI